MLIRLSAPHWHDVSNGVVLISLLRRVTKGTACLEHAAPGNSVVCLRDFREKPSDPPGSDATLPSDDMVNNPKLQIFKL